MPSPDQTASPWTPDGVFGFADCEAQGRALADALGTGYENVEVHYFPDSECKVRVKGRAKRPVLFRTLDRPNSKLVEIILAASVLREDGAADMALVAPYLPYMRQDIAFRPGEAVSQKVIGRMLAAHFDRFVSVDPHLHRTPTLDAVFGGKPALALTGAGAIAAHLKAREVPDTALVIGPDEESKPLVRAVAEPLNLSWTLCTKVRKGDRDVRISLPPQFDAHRRTVIIVDDVISSGTTIAALAQMLRDAAAKTIDVYATHALFDGEAQHKMSVAGARRIYSCDGVHHPTNAMPLAPVLAEGLRRWGGPTAP